MTDRYKFSYDDGREATEALLLAPLAFYAYALWTLREAAQPREATERLIAELSSSPLFEKNQAFCDDSEANAMASMWLARTDPKSLAAFASLPADSPAKAAIRGRFQWNAKRWRIDEGFSFWRSDKMPPEFAHLSAATGTELAAIEMGSLRAYYPGKPTSDPQKAAQYDDKDVNDIEALFSECSKLELLLANAQMEWKSAGIAFKRSNPFKSARQSREAGSFAAIENASALSGGSLWIAVRDNKQGLSFISPNGSSMREMSRAKLFSTKDEALCWFSPDAALEISWTFASFAPAPKASRASNQTLRAVQALREREQLAQASREGGEIAAAQSPRAKAKSL